MKKLIPILISLFLFGGYAYAEQSTEPATTATSTPASDNKTVALDNGLEIVSTQKHEEDATLSYVIDVNYPQISGDNLSSNAQAFNQLVTDAVNKSVQQFKNYVKADMPHMQTLPESAKHNTLNIDYDVHVIKPGNQTLLSVRLSIEGMQAGRAHPYHQHQVINFDLNSGKLLTLRELFKPKANYLNVFSKIASEKLNTTLQDKWMIKEGTAPLLKNYQLWNLQDDSILITFDEYQVAPYVDGAQEVEIPYSQLKNIIAPKSIIGTLVK